MRGLTLVAFLTALLTSVGAPALRAQTSPAPASSDTLATPPNALPAALAPTGVATPHGHSLLRRVATGLGAAVLGAGVSYLLSEVAVGDWDVAEGRGTINRATWMGVGGAAAFAFGFSFPIGGRGGSPGKLPVPRMPRRSVITAGEIQGSGATTAYDAVRSLRPEWFNQAHATTLGDVVVGGDIRVYLNSQLLGGLASLSSVNAADIKAIYRFDAGQAAMRWGAGHANGAIQVVTKN